MNRGFLPTWLATAGILAVQMGALVFLPDPPEMRAYRVDTLPSRLVAVAVLATFCFAWMNPRVRPLVWLTGTLVVIVLTLWHSTSLPAVPTMEMFAFYTVAAVMLAIGTWFQARSLS